MTNMSYKSETSENMRRDQFEHTEADAEQASIAENLYRHDLAACEVYKEVLSHIDDPSIKERIQNFLGDHERHVQNWKKVLTDLTDEEPSETRTLKGILLGGYVTARSMTGQDGALNALETAEEMVLSQYQDAIEEDLEPEVSELVQSHLRDEEKHTAYVKSLSK